MLSKRLRGIADMIPADSRIIDIGCDHALLDIYLTLEKNCLCTASDINPHSLEKSKNNIEKYLLSDKIHLILSDGLDNINYTSDDYIIMAGMGTTTILKILDNHNVNNLIIQTNKELGRLRTKLLKKYKIVEEKVILEKNIYYVITKFKLEKAKYLKEDILIGKFIKNDHNYIGYRKYLLNKGCSEK